MRASKYFIRSIFLCFLFSVSSATANEITRQCPDSHAVVTAHDQWDIDIACGGAKDAIIFFQNFEIDTDTPINIYIQKKVDVSAYGALRMRVYGLYDPSTNEVRVATLKSHRRMALRNPSFQLGFSRAMHRSIVAHEVAHAIAQSNFRSMKPNPVVHEYIAYVVQIATMPPELRDAVLQNNPVAPFGSVGQLNGIIHAMRPFVFGVKSYKHFVASGDRMALLQGILEEQLRPADPNF